MLYLDTCVLIPLFVQEASSNKVRDFFANNTQALSISAWSEVEFTSAMSLKVRSRQITHDSALTAILAFRDIAEESFSILLPSPHNYHRASEFLTHFNTGLRAGDALHLAIAHERHTTLITSDRIMLEAAKSLKISSSPL
ncbi:MAG TPA: type II toxin-antitoxin system VapC family toxin [Methylophilaceae bacterium]|nr:type II toxin-antitoxin system VapC family toxin [Methylophilaceae bacterium]